MARHHPTAPITAEEATHDLLRRLGQVRAGTGGVVLVLAVLAVAGLVALVALIASGPEPRAKWGYAAATLGFLVSAAQGAPIVAFATRLAKGFWGIPLRRAAELFAVSGIVTTPLYIVLLFQLPDWRGRPSVWFDWPGAPLLWDSIAIVMFSLAGLALLYLSSRPDFAAARDAGIRGPFQRLALGWIGTVRQWQVLSGGIVVLGGLYLMFYPYMHMFLAVDLGMSLVPGWKSAVFAPYHGVSGLQASLASTLLAAAALRHFGGLQRYIGLAPFWGAAKILLALSLLFFYFTWSEFMPTWYGRTPEEIFVLELLFFGPYLWLFILSFSLNFILPFLLLIWNPIRVSIKGPTFVAALVLIGNFIDRLRIYVASWSVAGPVGQHLEHAPPTHYPGLPDLLILVGGPAAVVLLYLLALRFIPPISLWEFKNGLLLTRERPYVKTEVAVVAKPR
ncbi:MAG TPA: hypothetical protein VFB73_11010 [Chloroflexota bacterium]|nr:hypothetical protein [Chloroflexota bacterium]